MWIERVEFVGFGNIDDAKIEFSPDRLNLVLEPNEYGKSTIAEAIWAVLYDYPSQRAAENRLKERDARKPFSGKPYKAALDVVHAGRRLRLVRAFSERTLKVFDRDRGDAEITEEFLSGASEDDLGRKLTGMSRELFRRTCFVGQRTLDDLQLGGDRDLASMLQSIADASGSATTSATAIAVLDAALAQFPSGGKKYRAERLIKELEERRQELLKRIHRLERQRQDAAEEIERLGQLEGQVAAEDRQIKSAEYFHLCLEAAEYDTRLMKAQERLLRVSDLKRQIGELSGYCEFPVERQRRVEELWTKRQARMADYTRLKDEHEAKEKQVAARDLEIRERWEGLADFTADDVQSIAVTARTLKSVLAEFSEACEKRKEELQRVKVDGIDMESLEGVRKALLNLEARDLDDAYAYQAMINSARDQIGECERSVWRERMILSEIQEQRKSRVASYRNNLFLLGVLTLLMGGLVAGILFGLRQEPSDPLALIGIVCLGGILATLLVNCVLMLRATRYRQRDEESSREGEQRQSALGQELHNKVMGLEIRLEDLARKAGVANGAELVKHIQAYAASAGRLKDLDLLDQVILSREAQVVNLKAELEPYFEKAGRATADIDPDAALNLSEEISRCLEERRSLDSSAGILDLKSSEIGFLQDQLKDLDQELKDHFLQARLETGEDVEAGFRAFLEAAERYRRWESLTNEMERMEQDTTSDLLPSDLPAIISRLEAQRDQCWARMEQIVSAIPNIAELPPPALDPKDPAFGREISGLKENLEALRRQKEDLSIHVRSATREYDEQYLPAVDELEEVERRLSAAKRARAALELARDTFEKLATETHTHWSARLNEISREMLSSLDTGYESLHFDSELNLTARRKGHPEPLQTANIKAQVSGGTKEQLHWLARMAVSRFLSHEEPLPLILDEPFSESDDERFLRMVRFLLGTLMKRHQVIVLSCHRQRHQWLLGELQPEERELITRARLEPLMVPSGS